MSSKSLKSFFQVELGVVTLNKTARQNLTRHKARFGITSFIYRSRKPFHPDRFGQQFVEPFFSKMNLLEGLEKVEEVEGVWPMPHPLRVGALAVLTPLIQT